ncbi:hypothetical protein ACJX0J_009577, partial [Zea mays]
MYLQTTGKQGTGFDLRGIGAIVNNSNPVTVIFDLDELLGLELSIQMKLQSSTATHNNYVSNTKLNKEERG